MGCILCCTNNKSDSIKITEEKKVIEYSWDQKKKLDPKDFTIENLDNCCTGRLPGTINGEQFIIQNCKNSRVYLLDNIGTITIDDCTNCDIIIGPVKTSIFIRDCSHCNIVVACQQFRTRDCHHLNVFLSCTSQPIIESTTKIKVAPYQLYYPELTTQFKAANLSPFNCNWSEIYDFTPVNDQGLNFALLPEDVRPFQLLMAPTSILNTDTGSNKGDSAIEETTFSVDVRNLEITDNREQSVIPYTYGNRRSVATTETTKVVSLVIIFHDVNQQKIALDLIRYVSQNSNALFLIKTREMILSSNSAESLFGKEAHTNDVILKGPIVSLEYIGSVSVGDCVRGFKADHIAISNIDSLIYVAPDTNTSGTQIDIINNVSSIAMNTA